MIWLLNYELILTETIDYLIYFDCCHKKNAEEKKSNESKENETKQEDVANDMITISSLFALRSQKTVYRLRRLQAG